jgi:hypothetical protein
VDSSIRDIKIPGGIDGDVIHPSPTGVATDGGYGLRLDREGEGQTQYYKIDWMISVAHVGSLCSSRAPSFRVKIASRMRHVGEEILTQFAISGQQEILKNSKEI